MRWYIIAWTPWYKRNISRLDLAAGSRALYAFIVSPSLVAIHFLQEIYKKIKPLLYIYKRRLIAVPLSFITRKAYNAAKARGITPEAPGRTFKTFWHRPLSAGDGHSLLPNLGFYSSRSSLYIILSRAKKCVKKKRLPPRKCNYGAVKLTLCKGQYQI